MKRLYALLAASTAMSMLGISAALADPLDFTAALGVGPGQTHIDGFGMDQTVDGYGVLGLLSGAYNFTPTLGAQGDLLLRYSHLEQDGNEANTTSLDGALHGFYREPERFLLGGIVQLGQDELDSGGSESVTTNRSLAGVEAQAFFDQFTVYGQLGLQKSSADNFLTLPDADGWFVTAEVRYFLNPDFKIEAHAGRSELNYDTGIIGPIGGNIQVEAVNFGVGAEYKFADMPFSVFGKYDFKSTSSNFVTDYSIDSHRVLVGLKFNLGDETLQDRDRNGASLKPVEFGGNSFGNGLPYAP